MVLSARVERAGLERITAHFNAAFLRKVEEIAHALTDLYCTVKSRYSATSKLLEIYYWLNNKVSGPRQVTRTS